MGSFAGRVVAVDGDRVRVADASDTSDVVLAEAAQLRAGDLVKLEGPAHAARLVEVHRPRNFGRAGGDPARFLFGGVAARLAARAKVIAGIRRWFDDAGFVEVETPLAVPSPGLDVHLAAMACDGGYLITSPEYQMKRLVAGGMPRVVQLARCFRQGELGARHNPEFTMLEWYRAFAGYEDVMADTEHVVRAAAIALRGEPTMAWDGRTIDLARPFLRITVADAFSRFAGIAPSDTLRLAADDEEGFFRSMVDVVEPALASFDEPVLLVDYPAQQASLARRKPDDPRWAERFELYVAGVELCNGFGELTDPVEQRARFEADRSERARRGLPVYPVDERFLAALEEGLPPCAGNALGVDRLVMLVTGASTLGDVQAFPAGVL